MPVPAIIQSTQPVLLSFLTLPLSSYIHAEWTSIPIKYEITKNDKTKTRIIYPEKSDDWGLIRKTLTGRFLDKQGAKL